MSDEITIYLQKPYGEIIVTMDSETVKEIHLTNEERGDMLRKIKYAHLRSIENSQKLIEEISKLMEGGDA